MFIFKISMALFSSFALILAIYFIQKDINSISKVVNRMNKATKCIKNLQTILYDIQNLDSLFKPVRFFYRRCIYL